MNFSWNFSIKFNGNSGKWNLFNIYTVHTLTNVNEKFYETSFHWNSINCPEIYFISWNWVIFNEFYWKISYKIHIFLMNYNELHWNQGTKVEVIHFTYKTQYLWIGCIKSLTNPRLILAKKIKKNMKVPKIITNLKLKPIESGFEDFFKNWLLIGDWL
jgi:hypothetical protein